MKNAALTMLLVVAGFTSYAAARGDRRVLAYLAVLGVLAAVAAVVHRRRPITPAHAWALSACGALHLVGGLVPGDPVFYETWIVEHVLKYDQLVHFTTSAVLTVVFLGRTGDKKKAIALALAAGFGNEVFEWLSALRYADAYVGGLTNARWDMVFNVFGCLTAAAAVPVAADITPSPPVPRDRDAGSSMPARSTARPTSP